MTGPAPHMNGDDNAGVAASLARVSALRGAVRRDLRATSVPLLLLGGAASAGVLLELADPGGWPSFLGDLFTVLLLAVAFAVVWQYLRRKARTAGVGHASGFGTALVMALLLLTVGSAASGICGPFLAFGVGLLVAGWKQRNRFLMIWALAAGGIGVFEGFFGITNRLPAPLWQSWEHPAIYLVIALATVLAGIVAWRRESRAR